jgi:hypothetical protein
MEDEDRPKRRKRLRAQSDNVRADKEMKVPQRRIGAVKTSADPRIDDGRRINAALVIEFLVVGWNTPILAGDLEPETPGDEREVQNDGTALFSHGSRAGTCSKKFSKRSFSSARKVSSARSNWPQWGWKAVESWELQNVSETVA